jgi:hypothetical protein
VALALLSAYVAIFQLENTALDIVIRIAAQMFGI